MKLFAPTNRLDEIYQKYEQIRSSYHAKAEPNLNAPTTSITPTNGRFFQNSTDYNVLTQHVAGFDKLFHTLVNGIVDDPDYAQRKDPQIYARMLRDPQIYYCLMVRKTATSSLPWQITPPDEFSEDPAAIQLAEASYARVKRIPQFRELLASCLNSFLPGMSVNELIWKVDENTGEYVIAHHFPKSKDRFRFRKDGLLTLLQPKSPTDGLVVPEYKFIVHRFQVRDGGWLRPEESGYVYYGQGLADTPLYHYFYFKVTAMRFMLKNLERNSSPFKVYYTGPQNAQVAGKLDTILAALQNDSVVGIPGKKGDTNVDVTPARGGAELYIGLIEYVDRLITRAILGQDLMTEMPSVGSYAAAQVHATVFNKLADNDRDLLQDTMNSTLMKYDALLNTPDVPEQMRPRFQFKSNALVDIGQFLGAAQAALSLGLVLSENQIRELSGFREPGPSERPLDASFMMAQQQMANEHDKEMAGAKEKGQAEGAASEKGKSKKASKKNAGKK